MTSYVCLIIICCKEANQQESRTVTEKTIRTAFFRIDHFVLKKTDAFYKNLFGNLFVCSS